MWFIALMVSLLPFWRNSPAKEGLNFWEFIREEPFYPEKRPHISVEEALRRAREAGYLKHYSDGPAGSELSAGVALRSPRQADLLGMGQRAHYLGTPSRIHTRGVLRGAVSY